MSIALQISAQACTIIFISHCRFVVFGSGKKKYIWQLSVRIVFDNQHPLYYIANSISGQLVVCLSMKRLELWLALCVLGQFCVGIWNMAADVLTSVHLTVCVHDFAHGQGQDRQDGMNHAVRISAKSNPSAEQPGSDNLSSPHHTGCEGCSDDRAGELLDLPASLELSMWAPK